MADYGVNIKFNIVGESGLDRAKKKAQELAKSVDNIRGIDIENPRNVGGKGGKRARNQIKKYRKDMENLVDTVNKGEKVFGKTANQQMAAAESLQDYVNQLTIGTPKHKTATAALQKQTKGLGLNNSMYLKNTILQNQNTKATNQNSKAKQENAKYQRGNMGNIASSAIIGGAFPLLFGQTGAAAVGGAAGGALGGIIGGQFGFALSIAGTAIGQFIQQQDELDKSLSKISRSFENAGHSAGFTRESFNQMRSTLRMTKDEVIAVATEFARFGEAGQSAAFIFGDNPNTFKNLAAMRDTKTLMTAILDTQNGLSIQQQIQLLREAKITSFKDMQLKVNRMILEENYRRELAEARQITRGDTILDILKEQLKTFIAIKMFINAEDFFPDFFKKSSENMEERVAEIQKFYDELLSDLPELQDLLTELDTQVQGMSYSIPSAIDSVAAELKKLMSVGYMVTTVADTVGSAFGESFKGIVKGSMTAQDALRNLFMRTADAFLDMAAQMIAKQIQMKILGIGLRFFGGGIGGGGGGVIDSMSVPLVDPLTGIGTAANGGPIPGRKPTLVGERGPELFTPGVSGYVTPNHELGGSTNIVVNVDASGSAVEGDEAQGRELGRLISGAVQSEIIQQKRPGGLLA